MKKLNTKMMVTNIVTNAIKDNVDVFVEEKAWFKGRVYYRVEFNYFKPISELLTNVRRVKVMSMISKTLGIKIWTTDYTTVEKSIRTDDKPIATNLNTDEICQIICAIVEGAKEKSSPNKRETTSNLDDETTPDYDNDVFVWAVIHKLDGVYRAEVKVPFTDGGIRDWKSELTQSYLMPRTIYELESDSYDTLISDVKDYVRDLNENYYIPKIRLRVKEDFYGGRKWIPTAY